MFSFEDGISLGELAPRLDRMDLQQVMGNTPVLVFRPTPGDEPLLFMTPAEGEQQVHPQRFLSDTASDPLSTDSRGGFASTDAIAVAVTKSNRNFEADDETVTLGRGRTNDIRLTSERVSKVHARVERTEGGEWRITDAGSANGTFVNGLRLEASTPHFLRPSDEVQLGDVVGAFLDADGLLGLCEALRTEGY